MHGQSDLARITLRRLEHPTALATSLMPRSTLRLCEPVSCTHLHSCAREVQTLRTKMKRALYREDRNAKRKGQQGNETTLSHIMVRSIFLNWVMRETGPMI